MISDNLLSILDLSLQQQKEIFDLASLNQTLFLKYRKALDGKILGSLFFQPSTRTQFSFQSAFLKLGGQCIGCSDINQTRSGAPYYEGLKDLGRIMSNYCDIVVMRTIDDNMTTQLADGIKIPMISAGSGNIEHPTQALTDLYTIRSLLGNLSGQKILIVGTPRQRTINSFMKGLAMWGDNEFHILCQEGIEISQEVKKVMGNSKIIYYSSWESLYSCDITKDITIIYIDKIFYETKVHKEFVPKKDDILSHFSTSAIILHPLPRTAELPIFFDELRGANYFEQAQNGLYVRSALFLKYLLS